MNRLAPLRLALAASVAVAAQMAAAPVSAETPKARIEGVPEGDLRDLIEQAIGESHSPATTRFEARRRARQAGEDAIAVLRSEGYYGYDVEADVADPDDEDSGQPPEAVLKVKTGPRFRIAAPTVRWEGEPPLADIQKAAEQAMALRIGATGRAATILSAEGRIIAALQARGYADATPGQREVVVDHADDTVRPTYVVVSGMLVRLDGVQLTGTGRSNSKFIAGLAPWKSGEIYKPDDIAELERRLLDTGVYDSVTVTLAPKEQLLPDGTRPVLVSLTDRPPHTLELGAGYSTSEGAGLDARWIRYNRLGRADTSTITLKLAQIEQRLEYRLALPHWRRPQQTLTLVGSAYNEQTDAYDQTGVGVSLDLTRRYGRTSFITVGAALDAGQVTNKQTIGVVIIKGVPQNLVTGSLLAAFALDRSSDPLDPRRGWRVEGRTEPTATFGDIQQVYLRSQVQGSYYLPLDRGEHNILAGRLELGTIWGGSINDIPASRRFYSGGGGSVRGYGYQGIGPRLSDNTPIGGRSLLEASIEYRRDITERWGAVAFLDVGAVGADGFPAGKDFGVGAGIGVRYNLGFGPIRADIAIPLDKRKGDAAFQIYISIGQSF
ncbi:translocation and assembly module TamA [Caulobacter ginsengisoli]|uniref:Translocation and assembly module subunit TamA n=1 Tax=Caulobacter ginsengisoli TaxID=400775 RepID=A0ABU0IPN0_9CAUL|nr:autotransporter assembly complex family protein [Caulobacter ginsengisoli]MDQ0463959.1 translocation and assembly module TamA [Caulobacter ginsengisoli]